MSTFPGPSNPIVYAQFNLQGGWRNTGMVCGAYAVLIGGAIWLTVSVDPRHRTQAMDGWMHGLLVLQLLALLVYGSFRVNAAVRADLTSNIIESHRLMPIAPLGAILGYVCGGPLQAIAIAVINVALGLACSGLAAIDAERWLVANAMLGLFALFTWCLIVQFAFAGRGAFILFLIAMGVTVASSGALVMLVPGVQVLTSPLIARSVLDLSGRDSADMSSFALSSMAQCLLALVCVQAAMRRYRAGDAPGFTPTLALLLVGAWVLTSTLGVAFPEVFSSRWRFYDRTDGGTRYFAALVSTMLLAMLPLAAAARARVNWQLDRGVDRGLPTPRAPLPVWATALIATALTLPLGLPFAYDLQGGHLRFEKSAALMTTPIVVFLFLLGLGYLYRWAYTRWTRVWIWTIGWLAITWVAPLIADQVYRALLDNDARTMTQIAAVSPVGALAMLWTDERVAPTIGLLAQCGFLVVPFALSALFTRRSNAAGPRATQAVAA